jgi:hypothetical protein
MRGGWRSGYVCSIGVQTGFAEAALFDWPVWQIAKISEAILIIQCLGCAAPRTPAALFVVMGTQPNVRWNSLGLIGFNCADATVGSLPEKLVSGKIDWP